MNQAPEECSRNNTEGIDYLRGVTSTSCLLSNTTSAMSLEFSHPLSQEINDELLLPINNDIHSSDNLGDSSSSNDSNSVVQDPVSAQLINNISMLDYQTLSKNGDVVQGQPEDEILNGNMAMNNRKLPGFVTWNWGLIRKILLWIVMSGLVACIAAIITMVITIPKSCNPDLPWYQGKVFYEIFPPSFTDSNKDGTGDFKGIINKLEYIAGLGASAIRLNYIFEASNYPEHYYNTTSLLKIDRSIGTLEDFQKLVGAVHGWNMSIILDIPVLSLAKSVSPVNINSTHTLFLSNDSLHGYSDETSAAIAFWARAQGVDGFYLKNLEDYVDDINFGKTLQLWKQIIGYNKILIASEEALTKSKADLRTVLLSRIDMIDVHLDLKNGINGLKDRIEDVISGVLWSKPHYPWVHWNIGNIDSERVATKYTNNTLALTTLQFMLPGTVSIFYGDEIGLGGLPTHDIEKDFHEHKHIYNLVPMEFSANQNQDSKLPILSWNSKSVLQPKYEYLDVIRNLSKIRLSTPTIYLRAIYKDGNILRNAKVRHSDKNLIVLERWHPRRNTCVFVGNLGDKVISTDLSSMFYGGTVVAGTNSSLIGQVLYFDEISFPPYSAIILKLEK